EPSGHRDHRRASLRRLGHDLHLVRLPLEGEPRVAVEGRQGHLDQLAHRGRRQGQRGRRLVRAAHQRRDRLRRVRVRAAEPHDVCGDAEQGRRVRVAQRAVLPGGGRGRGLEQGARHEPHAHRRAGQGRVADRRGHVHPRAHRVRQPGTGKAAARVLPMGVRERRQDRRVARLRADARERREADRVELERDQGFVRQAGHLTPALSPMSAVPDNRALATAEPSAVAVFSLLAAILVSLVVGSMPAIRKFGPGFLASAQWDPVQENFGALVPIYGTVLTSAIALAIAIPVSFGISVFLTELSPVWLRRPLGTAIEMLAAIPSIIYGMWGLFVFAPVFQDHVEPFLADTLGKVPGLAILFSGPPMGIGMLAAGIILAVMVIPFITAVMRDVFELVPAMLKESAYGLGSTTWEVVRSVVLPYTKVGVIGGIMLGLGRALGETMAVTFVIGNAHEFSASLFMPGNSIASALANEFNEAVGEVYTSALIELGLILFLITTVVLAASKLLLIRLARAEGTRT